jgi:betaine-homocysteine S-methyltransferase
MTRAKRSLGQRLQDGPVLCAEGYLFELERRGRLQAGSFVPEVALAHPESLLELHREFLDAGSDVVVAFTYNAHREKLKLIGREGELERLNRAALDAAFQAAEGFGGEPPLVAGNISNTNLYDPDDPASHREARRMLSELVGWAAEAGVDYVVAETFYFLGEAEIALEVVREAGLEAAVTLGLFASGELSDGWAVEEACRALEDQGAAVVGMNCFRGPATMLPHLEKIRAACSGPVAGLPVPYRTTPDEPTFFRLSDPGYPEGRLPHETTFPTALDPLYCNRYEMAEFARAAYDLGVRYLGVCCGCAPVHIRLMAEELGRTPPAGRYSPDMDKQFLFGRDPRLKKSVTALKDEA